jgi:hypothetical protein
LNRYHENDIQLKGYHENGYHPMDIIKWISSNGYHQMDIIQWIISNGYHPMDIIKWISSNGLTSHTNTKNKTTGSFLGYLDAERASE